MKSVARNHNLYESTVVTSSALGLKSAEKEKTGEPSSVF